MNLSVCVVGTAFVLLCVSEFVVCDQDVWSGCENVRPIWNKIKGRPEISLNENHGAQLKVKWSKDAVIHGSKCVQAFEVEYRQFGAGRLGWSSWSSVAACAILVANPLGKGEFECTRDLADIDCGKRMHFRVVLHNVFNNNTPTVSSGQSEAFIQCKDIVDYKIRKKLRPNSLYRGRKTFFVRTPHRSSFSDRRRKPQRRLTTKRPATTTRTTTRQAATRTATTTAILPRYSLTTTATTPATTSTASPVVTTTHAGEIYPNNSEEEEDDFVEGVNSPAYQPTTNDKATLIFLPGKFSAVSSRKSYEVRENLKNFESKDQDLRYCSSYRIYDISDECVGSRQVYRGMQPCLLMSGDKHQIFGSSSGLSTKRKFKMLLDPQCEGRVEFVKDLRDCEESCKEGRTFIVM